MCLRSGDAMTHTRRLLLALAALCAVLLGLWMGEHGAAITGGGSVVVAFVGGWVVRALVVQMWG